MSVSLSHRQPLNFLNTSLHCRKRNEYNLPTGMTTVPHKPVVGFRFHPTDKELLSHFLRSKNQGLDYKVQGINVVNLCNFEPWDLPAQSYMGSDDGIWYFFCSRDFKYSKSKRRNRTTEKGYWKPTGKPRRIPSNKKPIGWKKTLVFYLGRPKGTRTNWVIHEYDFCAPALDLQGDFVLCRLKLKSENIGQNEISYVENEFQSDVNTSMTSAGTPLITPSNLENQNWIAPSNLENQIPIAPSNLENQIAPSNLENQTLVAPSDLENALIPFNFESQICEGIPPAMIACDLENTSSYWKDDLILLSDFENYPSTNSHNQENLAYGECVLSSMAIPFGFGYESPDDKVDCLFISDLENQIPNFDSKGGDPSSVREPEIDKDELNCLMGDDSVKFSSEEKAEIPVTQDGASSSLKSSLSGFESQNTDEYWISLMSLYSESGEVQVTMSEVEVNLCLPECNFGPEDLNGLCSLK
ncbi:hypothetical protein K2173_003404 [Erythroxylum novogranatense]|uniref:NAC domain-containing protein n=1 Tax=Erythroxylum novogranatense TaxID=1862640 RepID=A0AAV8S8I4_9ROSI|nr:hypothetical protein K2173_003404 [Erythroxylum novogranatense]